MAQQIRVPVEELQEEQIRVPVDQLEREPDFRSEVVGDTSKLDRLLALLPMAGGAAGGIIGGIGGTIGGIGVGGIPGAVGGATLGGVTGESLRQLLSMLLQDEGPRTVRESATGMAKQGAIEGGAELAGGMLMRGAARAGRSLIDNAIRPPETLLREFPNVIDTAIKERVPVGRGVLSRLRGSQQAKGLLRESSRTTRGLLREAGEAGTRFSPQEIAADEIAKLAGAIKNQPISGPDLRRLSDMTMTYLREHGEAMTPQAVKDMKRAAQALAKSVFKAQQAGSSVAADQALGARFNEAIASGAKTALETIEGIAQSEARTRNLIGLTRAVTKAEARRLPLVTEGVSGAAAVIASLAQPGGGADDRLRNALVAWAVTRGLGSPRSISRAGLHLTSAQVQEALRQVPRLAEAVSAQINAGPSVEPGRPR